MSGGVGFARLTSRRRLVANAGNEDDEASLLILDRVEEGVLRSSPPTMHGFSAVLKGAGRSWNLLRRQLTG